MRRGDAVPLHEFFRKTLTGFELSGGPGGSENRPSASVKLVHNAELQRNFGPDNSEIGLDLVRRSQQRLYVLQVSGNALSFLADAAVAGRAINLRNAR